jgi:hypothetical protein
MAEIYNLLMNEKAIAGVLGLLGGLLATFVAPWIQWGVEHRRLRFQNRKEAITHWREGLASVSANETWADSSELEFVLSQTQVFLRPHPSPFHGQQRERGEDAGVVRRGHLRAHRQCLNPRSASL